MLRYLENGGIRSVLYGGNANFYHIRPSEYATLLGMLQEIAGEDTWMIPSAGPSFGVMMDQAQIARDFGFPTIMLLPHRELATSAGIESGVRQFAEALGKPVVLYIKHDGWIDVDSVKKIVDDGLVSFIKYAIVRDDPAQDDYLRELVANVDPGLIVSGIGEQPAIVHLRDFGLTSFTSGCVCVAPSMSMRMLSSIQSGEYSDAEVLREQFSPLEDLRNEIHPIRVLHDAVALADIASTGPILPLLSPASDEQRVAIGQAAKGLRQLEQSSLV